MRVELRVLRMRVTTACPHAVGDAWSQPLPLTHLMPFPLACVTRFATLCGIAEELVGA